MREIQQAGRKSIKDLSWVEDFRLALSTEDLALTTVRAYCGDLESFLRWYAPHLAGAGLVGGRHPAIKRCGLSQLNPIEPFAPKTQ